MMGGVLWRPAGKAWLIVVAAPVEGAAVLRGRGVGGADPPVVRWSAVAAGDGFELLVTGVGKGCAAGGVARVLDPAHHAGVINLGLAGALPVVGDERRRSPAIGSAVLASRSVYGDEGVPTPEGRFLDVASLGFAPNAGMGEEPGVGVEGDATLGSALRGLADEEAVIATVSECSGTDERAAMIAARTGALAEAMEGAAVGFAVRRISGGRVAFAEMRVVSNTTGDRGRQVWDARAALARVEDLVRRL